MGPCRVACVKYLNTVPLIHGLDKLAGVELIPTVPARIAAMVRAGEADVGLVSVVDAAAGEGEPLALLPVGMIGCDGPTLTVRVFSSAPIERITTVAADTDSHTSVRLCEIVLEKLYGVKPRFAAFDARERVVLGGGPTPDGTGLDDAWPETVLLIGDKVVTDAPPRDRYPHQIDLGEAWKRLTGLPFVYAVWACRADRIEDPAVQSAMAILDRQRRRNTLRLDWIVSTEAPEHRWPEELAREYLGRRLRFEVGPREREAVSRFFELAGLGEATWADAPRFAPAEPPAAV
jgi:predicted solute-binding protein